jgi:uncharacterized membrane protein YqjE
MAAADPRAPGAAADGAPDEPSTPEALADVAREAWELGGAHLRLAVLEAKAAGRALVFAIGALVLCTMLAMCAWVTLVTAIVLWIAGVDREFVLAFFAVFALNVVVAAVVGGIAYVRVKHQPFAATLRQFKGDAHAVRHATSG